jgi:Fe-S-cluster containining protein
MSGNGSQPVDQLERQVVRASQFTQASLGQLADRLSAIEMYLNDLVEALRLQGVVTTESIVEDEAESADEDPCQLTLTDRQAVVQWPGIAFRDDSDETAPSLGEVDCEARMSICHAVCCKLNFALTPEELDTGIKWDLGFPYFIRHEANGYCSHNDVGTGGCNVYADRPAVCRRYSCANDTRIWKDFEAMVLNEEWLDEHLASRGRIVLRPSLPSMDPGR